VVFKKEREGRHGENQKDAHIIIEDKGGYLFRGKGWGKGLESKHRKGDQTKINKQRGVAVSTDSRKGDRKCTRAKGKGGGVYHKKRRIDEWGFENSQEIAR